MASRKLLGYGGWRSPITSDLIVAETIGLGQPKLSGDSVFWVEQRPSEAGRNVIVRRRADGRREDVNPAPYNARSRVHEYGGDAYLPAGDRVFFTRYDDQMLYVAGGAAGPARLTGQSGLRFADGALDARRNRLISVCEDHSAGKPEPRNFLCAVSLVDGSIAPLVS